MSRGGAFGSETTKFVTKRTCLVCVFSMSFLFLLVGFILGRVVSDKILVIRDANSLQELEGNGMTRTLDLRDTILKTLNHSSYHETVDMIPEVQLLRDQELTRTHDLFKDLSIFKTEVHEISNCTVATICGKQEQDRYIVLSASGEGYDVAYKVAKSFDDLHRNKGWEPKRTIIFCVFLSEIDSCMEKILDHIKPKIVAYIAIHGKAARGHKSIIVSGSGMVQATTLDALDEVESFNGYKFNVTNSPEALPRLNIDIPHAVLSFIDENKTDQYTSENQKTLAQIAGVAIFRLSEQVFLKWNPRRFHEIMNMSLDTLDERQEIQEMKENLTTTVENLIEHIQQFNSMLDKTNMLKLLHVRMVNDKLIDLDRALLCPDPYSRSKTDFVIFKHLSLNSPYDINMHLNNINNCYKAASRIILHEAQCKHIIEGNDDYS